MDPIQLRNRLLVATGMWREATGEPLPRMPPGDPAEQIQIAPAVHIPYFGAGTTT